MKQLFVAAIFIVLLAGCDKSNPVENDSTAEALYSEETMVNAAMATDAEIGLMHGEGPAHDSIRHGRMLGHLKLHLGLSEEQFDSVKLYAKTMFETIKDIRTQVHDSLITREQARALVVEARAQFVASVKTVLTEDQLVKFERWVTYFWNKPPHRGGPGGRRGHGGPGGPGVPGRP